MQVVEPLLEFRAESAAGAVIAALAFGGGVWAVLGPDKGAQYFAGYLLEQSLSGAVWWQEPVGLAWRPLLLYRSRPAPPLSLRHPRHPVSSPSPPFAAVDNLCAFTLLFSYITLSNRSTVSPPLPPRSRQPVCLHPRLQLLQDPGAVPVQGALPRGWDVLVAVLGVQAEGPVGQRSKGGPSDAVRLAATPPRAHMHHCLTLALLLTPSAGIDVRNRHRCGSALGADCGGRRHWWVAEGLLAGLVCCCWAAAALAVAGHTLCCCSPSVLPCSDLCPRPLSAVERFEPVLLLFAGILLVSSVKLLL